MERGIVILILGQLAFTGFILWMVFRGRENRMRQRSEERSRMLERFSSGQELNEFLSSSAGARYLELLGERVPPPSNRSPRPWPRVFLGWLLLQRDA